MTKKKIDIITLELINNFLYSVVDEMTLATVRTSFSPLTRDSYDFLVGLCCANGETLLEGEGALVHSLHYPHIISNWMQTHGSSTYPDDIIITNDTYSGGAHLPDIFMMQPIFGDDDNIMAWAVAGGHLGDVGGSVFGSCACDSREIYQEGLRVPPMKLYERGVLNNDLLTIYKANSRTPEIIEAGIEAFRAACYTGKERFLELVKEHGWHTLRIYLDELLNYAERMTRDEIGKMPDGVYEFTDYMDDDGINPDLLTIHVKITIAGDEITYDFTGTSTQGEGAMNNPLGTSRATVLTALREMINPDIPRNGGAWRPVNLIIPEGTILNPRLPAAVAGRAATAARQSDVILGAQSQIRPDKMPACTSTLDHLLNIGGRDRDGKPFILVEVLYGGWGGRPNADGIDHMSPPFGNVANQPCETNERLYPIMYNQYAYMADREGPGKYRGSAAIIRDYKFIGDKAVLQLRTDRQRTGTYGLYGGQRGTPSESIINPDNENRHIGKITMDIKNGDVYRLITAGGGGWGDPLERDVRMVLDVVRNEKISLKRAKETYGVVINKNTMGVDVAETQRLRNKMKRDRK